MIPAFFPCCFYPCYLCASRGFQSLFEPLRRPRGGLATWTKVAAPPCHDQPLDFCLATKARLPVALVDPVLKLEFAAIAVGIDVVGNGRAAGTDGFGQNLADCAVERQELLLRQVFRDARRMQARAKQALVRIDVADAAQDALVEQQGLDASAPRSKFSAEFLRADLQRLLAQLSR